MSAPTSLARTATSVDQDGRPEFIEVPAPTKGISLPTWSKFVSSFFVASERVIALSHSSDLPVPQTQLTNAHTASLALGKLHYFRGWGRTIQHSIPLLTRL